MYDEYLTYDASRRMAGTISPIYRDAKRFLKILDALGGQMQELNTWAEQLKNQAMPQTADWALALWEKQYGLEGISADSDKRRAQLISRVRAVGSANPASICRRAGAAAHCDVRATENTAPNEFTLYVNAITFPQDALRAAVDAVKPAHLTYRIKREKYADCRLRAACGVRWARRYTLSQSD